MYGCHRLGLAAPARPGNNSQIRSLAWSEAKIPADPQRAFLPRSLAGMGGDPCLRMLPAVPHGVVWVGTFPEVPSQQELPRERIPSQRAAGASSPQTLGTPVGLARSQRGSLAVPEAPGSARSSDPGGIRAAESPESRGWAQRQSPGPLRDGVRPVPGSTSAFLAPCRSRHGRDEPLSCFSQCSERCLSLPGQGRRGCRAGRNRPRGLLCPPYPSGHREAAPARQLRLGVSGDFKQTPQNFSCFCR